MLRITACLTATDMNPVYWEFFPVFHRAWKELVGIRPLLVLIADQIPKSVRALSQDVILFPPIRGVSTAFQAQCIRLLYPALLDRCDGSILISDIDMVPMNRSYYLSSVEDVPNDQFVVYRSNILIEEYRHIAICYNAALPDTWRKVFGPIRDEQDVRSTLIKWWSRWGRYDCRPGHTGWVADQAMLSEQVMNLRNASRDASLVFLDDAKTGFLRVDRNAGSDHLASLPLDERERIATGAYSDYHMLRPHAQYRSINEQLVEIAIAGQRGAGAPARVAPPNAKPNAS